MIYVLFKGYNHLIVKCEDRGKITAIVGNFEDQHYQEISEYRLYCLEDSDINEVKALDLAKMNEAKWGVEMVYESIDDLDFNIADVLTQTTIIDGDFDLPHRGYFGDSITDIQGAINRGDMPEYLVSIRGVFDDKRYVSDTNKRNYLYFLPLERVKRKVRVHYRPFKSVEEMEDYLDITLGDAICLRSTTASDMPYKVMYVGCGLNSDRVIFGGHVYDFDELFEKYEFSKDDEEWSTFGMLEEDHNAKDQASQMQVIVNNMKKAIQDHIVSLDTDGIADYVGEMGYFFDISDATIIADAIMNSIESEKHYGEFTGTNASITYPLCCEDSNGHENNWKFFIPGKYLKSLK